VSYNTSAVKIYSAASSVVRFENRKGILYFEKNACVVVENSEFSRIFTSFTASVVKNNNATSAFLE
jgi:hypothetical protein